MAEVPSHSTCQCPDCCCWQAKWPDGSEMVDLLRAAHAGEPHLTSDAGSSDELLSILTTGQSQKTQGSKSAKKRKCSVRSGARKARQKQGVPLTWEHTAAAGPAPSATTRSSALRSNTSSGLSTACSPSTPESHSAAGPASMMLTSDQLKQIASVCRPAPELDLMGVDWAAQQCYVHQDPQVLHEEPALKALKENTQHGWQGDDLVITRPSGCGDGEGSGKRLRNQLKSMLEQGGCPSPQKVKLVPITEDDGRGMVGQTTVVTTSIVSAHHTRSMAHTCTTSHTMTTSQHHHITCTTTSQHHITYHIHHHTSHLHQHII